MERPVNFVFALIGGTLAAVVGAIVWAAITAATNFQIGYMAIAVGFLVAFAVRFCGRSHNPSFAYLSAVLSLAGCVLGNFLASAAQASNAAHVDVITGTLRLIPHFGEIIGSTFQVIDLLFYAFGVYFGYKYALVPLRPQSVAAAPADASIPDQAPV